MAVSDPHLAAHASPPSLYGVGLCLGYRGSEVVHDATVALHAGEVMAFVGPNGSGKSTLLRSLARLHSPDAGDVVLNDTVSALSLTARDFARRATLLAQSRPTPSGIPVRDVVGYGRHPYRGRWRHDDPAGPAAIGWAMGVTGVAGMADRGVDELSGGEHQRVWLATCLAQQTQVLLLDEPTTFLDLRYQVEILDLIRDLADDHGVAVGLVLHDLNHAAAIADRVALLDQGRIVATGPPERVLTGPRLSATYGIHIDAAIDPATGTVSTRPMGRHNARVRAPE